MLPLAVSAGELELEGTFQGENLYVKNPFNPSGVGFCVYEVTVNGITTTDEINSSAFEIDLSVFEFTPGDPLSVGIHYKDGCKPYIINPEVIAARATYKTTEIAVKDDVLIWETTNEAGSLRYTVEQFRWNKWVKVGEVKGIGSPGTHRYTFQPRLHAGENRFRVKQVDYRNIQRLSPETTVLVDKPLVTLASDKVTDLLTFSQPTLFEIYDNYGRIMFKGFEDTVNVAGLKSGSYYLNFDNQMARFSKR